VVLKNWLEFPICLIFYKTKFTGIKMKKMLIIFSNLSRTNSIRKITFRSQALFQVLISLNNLFFLQVKMHLRGMKKF